MNKNNYKNNYYIIIIILLIIFFLIIIKSLLYYNIIYKSKKYENFNNIDSENMNNINLALNFQSGISSINSTGTIYFNKSFLKPPMIFTQIIGNNSGISNVYSIQVFDIKKDSFNYSKNKAYNSVETSPNSESTTYIIPKISESNIENFMWIAIG